MQTVINNCCFFYGVFHTWKRFLLFRDGACTPQGRGAPQASRAQVINIWGDAVRVFHCARFLWAICSRGYPFVTRPIRSRSLRRQLSFQCRSHFWRNLARQLSWSTVCVLYLFFFRRLLRCTRRARPCLLFLVQPHFAAQNCCRAAASQSPTEGYSSQCSAGQRSA